MMDANRKHNNQFFVCLTAAIAAIGGFLFGYDTGIISGALIFIQKSFEMTTFDKELIVSMVVLGAFIGAMFSGRLADYFGRRKMLITAAITFIIGTGIVSFAVHIIDLIMGRFILGLAIGITSYTVPLFISEMAPANSRGRLVLLSGIMISGGEAIAFLVDYALIPTHSWRLMFATGFIPAILFLIGMLFMPATPRWLSLKGLKQQAMKVLQRIRQREDVAAELAEIQQHLHQKQGTWRDLFSKRIRPVLIIGLGLGILQQFVGINTVMYYGPYIFKAAHFQGESTQILATFIMGVVNTLGTIIAVFTVDRFGRRPLLIWGMTVSVCSLAIVGYLFKINSSMSHFLMICFMVTYIFGYAVSLGSLFWLIIAEIYPLRIRGLAMSFVAGVQWIANFVVAITFLSILHRIGPSDTFWLYGLMCLIAIAFAYFWVPETKGFTLEQIETNLDGGQVLTPAFPDPRGNHYEPN